MKILYLDTMEIGRAEKIMKKNNDIIGYNGDYETFALRGISDFSHFIITLEDGTISEFDPVPKTETEILRDNMSLIQKALDEVILGGML